LLFTTNTFIYGISLKTTLGKSRKHTKYYLHKDDFSKLHFEVQDLKSYFDRHKAQASKAHTHGFIN
jgi:hypothetical protein